MAATLVDCNDVNVIQQVLKFPVCVFGHDPARVAWVMLGRAPGVQGIIVDHSLTAAASKALN